MKYSLTLLFSIMLAWATAQDTTSVLPNFQFGVAPLGLVNKVRFKAEYVPMAKKRTYGSVVSLHYPLVGTSPVDVVHYSGLTIEPFVRWYGKELGNGFYFQAKGFAALIKYEYALFAFFISDLEKGTIMSTGLGAGLGYQYHFGKGNKWMVDSSIGLRITGSSDDYFEYTTWYRSGPGSLVNPMILIGYKL